MKQITAHANSMAARKWGLRTWATHLPDAARSPGGGQGPRSRELRAYFRLAALAARRGDHELATRLRASAMRASQTTHYCG